MLKPYRTIDDVLRSPWATVSTTDTKVAITDRVLRSSKLEDNIYSDLRSGDEAMAQMEQSAEKKLRSFPALSRDVYQSFYSLIPRRNDDSVLSTLARKFNAPILDHIVQSEDYPTLKSVCEGRELPAYEAAVEFIGTTANELDSLLSDISGDKGGLNTLEKLKNAETQAKNELADLLERMQRGKEKNPQLEQSAVDAANKVESKHQQVEAVSKMIDAGR